ncbi:HigA family addiction module antitoxin [Leptolyngbya sp. AN03gr2]|uniref:HigA family addiction module antitoxin n=1 Tax=unclassified Leptolyngbya TaxID=2650499 RepID=UPI003D31D3BF
MSDELMNHNPKQDATEADAMSQGYDFSKAKPGRHRGFQGSLIRVLENGTEQTIEVKPRQTAFPTDRPPTHPGELLSQEFLQPMGITQHQLADAIHVPVQQIDEIVNGRQGITPSTALRLAKYFQMSPDFWLNSQLCWDLYHAHQAELTELDTIQPIR